MDDSTYPIHFDLPGNAFLLKVNTLVVYKGSCEDIPELGARTSTVEIYGTDGEICDLTSLAKSARLSLKRLKIHNGRVASTPSSNQLILDGLEYLHSLDLSNHQSSLIISPPSEPFHSIELLSLPKNYTMTTPVVICGEVKREIEIINAVNANSLIFLPASSDTAPSFSTVTFIGQMKTSPLSFPIDHVIVDQLKEDDRTSQNPVVKVLTFKNDNIPDLATFSEIIGNLPGLVKGEIIMSGNNSLVIKDPTIHDKWRIFKRTDDFQNNIYIFTRRRR
jgi:hypothetical protein